MARGKQPITSFTAGRAIRLDGTLYAKGASIPTAVVGGLKKASTLLSRRWIVPGNAQFPSRRSARGLVEPGPVTINPKERRGLGA